MIEVITFDSYGTRLDTAEADSPESAVAAARALLGDARDANPRYGNRPTVSFYVDGHAVRSGLRYV